VTSTWASGLQLQNSTTIYFLLDQGGSEPRLVDAWLRLCLLPCPFSPSSRVPTAPSPSPSNGFAPSPSLEQIEALRVHCCRHDRRLRSRGCLTSCSSVMLPDGRRSGASLSGARRLRPLSIALAGFAPSPLWIEAARHHQGGRRPLL
jgi:hypothetical protein